MIEHEGKEGDDFDKYDPDRDKYYNVYQFPVDINDIGNATLLAEDKAIYFMRWIRRAREEGTLIKI
jgi:hypothetical protein